MAGFYKPDERDKRREQGEDVQLHGLDMGKRFPWSMFNLPAQPQDPSGAFFRDENGAERDELDPVALIDELADQAGANIQDNVPQPMMPAAVDMPGPVPMEKLWDRSTNAPQHLNSGRIARALERWRTEGVLPGRGNRGFFRLAMELHRAGMSIDEIEQTLVDEAQQANSPEDRLKQIPGILEKIAGERDGELAA